MLLTTAAAHHVTESAQSNLIGPLSTPAVLAIAAALLLWIVVYMLYRLIMTRRKDFGVPVRRRILCRSLRVENDQSAEVPFWWTDLQIQHAVGNHWRSMLRSPALTGNDPQASL